MFDITTQAVNDLAAIHLKDASGEHMYHEGKKVEILLYSPGSPQAAQVEARQTARAIKRMQDNDGKISVAAPDVRDAEQAEDLAAITAGFRNFGYPPAGEKQGQELYAALYADKSLGFIANQVMKAFRDWGNFKPGSSAI